MRGGLYHLSRFLVKIDKDKPDGPESWKRLKLDYISTEKQGFCKDEPPFPPSWTLPSHSQLHTQQAKQTCT